ncbi:MAG: serine/threonine protein phosphatase [Gammaproteobacteria bacterium]|nr:MAG: serine/threonine protein phosphatase [Gammaproteobacteria bacterium]
MSMLNFTNFRPQVHWLYLCLALLLCYLGRPAFAGGEQSFTLAVIPDTQNYIDFRHQKAAGFELDAADLFIQQMRYVASRSVNNGGDIAFVASVGDVWQHQTKTIDQAHLARGIGIEPSPILARRAKRADEVMNIELPRAIEGYRIISASGLPFGVAPGNHDYDAAWSVIGYPPNRNKTWSEISFTVADMGIMHVGGLDNFRHVFGADTDFFRDKTWYVASYNGGSSSAQRFSAGGYEFLHIALEMQPGDAVLRWAQSVLEKYPGLPTIVTTHDYLSTAGKRLPNPLIDLARIEPENHNSAEQLWRKFLRRHDQIFLVLCGHQHGQGFRVDANLDGNPVYQVLADYQARGQTALQAGRRKRVGVGDGWLRLMTFDFAASPAQITIKTFSSHYGQYSSDLPQYAAWYREKEQPGMSDSEFLAADFVIRLDGFAKRFVSARQAD